MENKNLIVISFDGLSSLDFEYISNLPNFREFLKNSSFCKNVNTIYPSLTYPAHASIVTGKYPKNHKVINNTILDINRKNPDCIGIVNILKVIVYLHLQTKKGLKWHLFFGQLQQELKLNIICQRFSQIENGQIKL